MSPSVKFNIGGSDAASTHVAMPYVSTGLYVRILAVVPSAAEMRQRRGEWVITQWAAAIKGRR